MKNQQSVSYVINFLNFGAKIEFFLHRFAIQLNPFHSIKFTSLYHFTMNFDKVQERSPNPACTYRQALSVR